MFSRGQPRYYYQEQASLPPLSLLALGTMLQKSGPDLAFEIIDAENLKLDRARMRRELEKREYGAAGVTCLSNTLADAHAVARASKEVNPAAPVIFGGFHPTVYPNETINLPGVDFVCLGAGDFSLPQLLGEIGRGNSRPEIHNIIHSPIPPESVPGRTDVVKDYSNIPIPDRSLLPISRYFSAITQTPPATVMMSGTGCPYGCSFCNTPKTIHAKPVEYVAEEMARCEQIGIREILFQDELFTYNDRRTTSLCEEIKRRRLTVPWAIKTRIDTITPALMETMRDANMFSVHFGVESGSEKTLDTMRKGKGYTIENIRNTIAEAKKLGLNVTASFMIGYIGETEQDVMRTIGLARGLRLDYAQFAIAQPLPFTKMYEEGMKRRLFKTDIWREFATTADPAFEPPCWTETLSEKDLRRLLNLAYRRFYINKTYVLSRLRSRNAPRSFIRNAKIAIRIALGF